MRDSTSARPAAVLLDLDGTLVDSLDDIAATVNHLREIAGLGTLDREGVRGMLGDGAQKLCERALAGSPRGLGVADVWEAYDAHHREQCTRHVRLYDGVRDWLENTRAQGTKLAVVTNKPEAFARRIVEHLDIAAFFDTVVGGDTTSERKPSPLPLLTALDTLGIAAADATMIGDGEQDIRAGKAAGCRTVGVLFGFRDAALVRAEAPDALWSAFGVVA